VRQSAIIKKKLTWRGTKQIYTLRAFICYVNKAKEEAEGVERYAYSVLLSKAYFHLEAGI
jgi:hypothetical protein